MVERAEMAEGKSILFKSLLCEPVSDVPERSLSNQEGGDKMFSFTYQISYSPQGFFQFSNYRMSWQSFVILDGRLQENQPLVESFNLILHINSQIILQIHHILKIMN